MHAILFYAVKTLPHVTFIRFDQIKLVIVSYWVFDISMGSISCTSIKKVKHLRMVTYQLTFR